MALVPIEELLVLLGVTDRDPATVMRYDLLRQSVEAAVKRWCHWEIEAADAVEYLDGQGYRDLPLARPWVQSVSEVCLDPGGYYGDGPAAFGEDTVLEAGVDYVLVKDQAGRGLLRRLASNVAWWPSDYAYAGGPGGPVALSYVKPLGWPVGCGNLKVSYQYGFPATQVPDDIRLAVCTAVGIVRNTIKGGVWLTSETSPDYSYSGQPIIDLGKDSAMGPARALLAAYRDTAI